MLMGQHCWSDSPIRYVSAHQAFMQNTPQLSSCTTSAQLLCPDLSEYIFMASFHGAETEENVKGIHIFHPQCSLWVVHSASETMQTMYKKENIVYLVTIWAPVSFSGGTYQRGLLLTAALRAWPPSSVHHYYVTMLCTAVSQPHMGTLKCPVLQCFAQLNQTQVWVWIQTAV